MQYLPSKTEAFKLGIYRVQIKINLFWKNVEKYCKKIYNNKYKTCGDMLLNLRMQISK